MSLGGRGELRLQHRESDLDAEAICRTLATHGVACVLIGGIAAILRGSTALTTDLDMVPQDDDENLTRLMNALVEMKAEVRGAGRVMPLPDGEWLRAAKTWNFRTDFGNVDVLFVPAGTEGYRGLVQRSDVVELVPGVAPAVASIDDLIAMKEAANRPKDQLALPILRWLRDRDASADA